LTSIQKRTKAPPRGDALTQHACPPRCPRQPIGSDFTRKGRGVCIQRSQHVGKVFVLSRISRVFRTIRRIFSCWRKCRL